MLLHKDKITRRILFVAFILAWLSSCGEKIFPRLEVQDSSIDSEKAEVLFSAPVKPSSLKENFIFTQDDANIAGEFFFEGRKIIFYPNEAITENHCYEITVQSGVEDFDGNSLEEDYKKKFYTKEDLTPPKISKIENITDDDGNTTSLKISFTKEMDEFSFDENFSLEPPQRFITKWNDTKDAVELFFEDALFEKTFYSIKISSGTKDSKNNFLENDFFWHFENHKDYIAPKFSVFAFHCISNTYEPISYIAENIDFSKSIEIRFNKKIDSNMFAQSISVEPQISYEIAASLDESGNLSDCARLIFSERPKWNTLYRLFISSKIMDGAGTPVAAKEFVLKNNLEKLRPPKFEYLVLNVGGEYKAISAENDFCDLSFDPQIYQPNVERDFPITFVFSISGESQTIDEISAMKSIDISPQNSCATITMQYMNICSYNHIFEYRDEIFCATMKNAASKLEVDEKNLVCVNVGGKFTNLEMSNSIAQGLINFKIAKTLCDDNKNYMEEAVQISCNKK